MSSVVPGDGADIAILVTAGNARLLTNVTSVAERSNVVAFKMRIDDTASGIATPAQTPVIVPPVVTPPAPVQGPPDVQPTAASIAAQVDQLEILVKQMDDANAARYQALTVLLRALLAPPTYSGTLTLPYFGSKTITLTPVKP
jgi:hypothetical protein